ncbi:hypothetical protein F4818DRAFT_454807 [Hypoxylon cercidicola]|nr:hypothetical protein F4818DRAFT_454807 [Hypoxylon cercidicola]
MADLTVVPAVLPAQTHNEPETRSPFMQLPPEIKYIILGYLEQDGLPTRNTANHILLSYASVCRFWHNYFESRIYRHLTLTSSALREFRNHIGHRSRYVERIWLQIELGTYSCQACAETNVDKSRRDNDITAGAIRQLFMILGMWTEENAPKKGVELELSIYCPSDSEHTFPHDLHLGRERFEHAPVPAIQHCQQFQHSAVDLGVLKPASLENLFTTLHPRFKGQLATLDFVTKFTVRRQTRRALDAKSLARIFRSLPNLESVIYEPWRDLIMQPREHADAPYDSVRDDGYMELFATMLPNTLKTLTVFEDFSEEYNTITTLARGLHFWENVRTPNALVACTLAYRSVHLEELYASYIIDASHFFVIPDSTWEWPNLKSISLTDHHLTDSPGSARRIQRMLRNAGRAAFNMPNLERMEIWNGMARQAGVFRYQVSDGVAIVSWTGTWRMDLNREALAAWRRVARKHPKYIMTSQRLEQVDIMSHADAIEQLGINPKVIHPVSLEQIQRETINSIHRQMEGTSALEVALRLNGLLTHL